MKSNSLRTFFEWALMTSVLMSIGFFVWYLLESRSARGSEVQTTAAKVHIQNNQAWVNSLAAECRDYARTNQEMARFLASFSQPASAAPSKPATR
jgi:hypothetical protein